MTWWLRNAEEAAKNPILAQLKVVQEAGDPNF